jgi:hypothetical protein
MQHSHKFLNYVAIISCGSGTFVKSIYDLVMISILKMVATNVINIL